MIVKILSSASKDFHGVQYNDNKIEKGTGELLTMKNFPDFINENSSQEEVQNYLKTISKSKKIQKPQFHAVISTKFQEHSKEELADIAEIFMQEMGYEKQPYTVVFHNDTNNNHVHIVSTRVDKTTGKKINDSYERLKAQRAVAIALEKKYGINPDVAVNKLLTYQYQNLQQLKTLLETNGFKLIQNKNNENNFDILQNGVKVRTIKGNNIEYSQNNDQARKRQIKAFLSKYKDLASNKVFKIEDRRKFEGLYDKEIKSKPKIEFSSAFQQRLKQTFGLDIVFHHKDGQTPFGYTLIDNKNGTMYKGSEIMKMNELFEFTDEVIDKKTFEILKNYRIPDEQTKQALIAYYNHQNRNDSIKDFMFYERKHKIGLLAYREIKADVKNYLKTAQGDVEILKSGDELYAIHTRSHHIQELRSLIGDKDYETYINGGDTLARETRETSKEVGLTASLLNIITELTKPSYTGGRDPAEDDLKRKRKKRKK